MTKLVIIEAPNKMHTINKILGADYIVRATVGHIVDLATGKGNDFGVDIKNGFKPKYQVMPDKIDKLKAIIDAAKLADEIIIASDDDREGEAIAFHVKNQLDKLQLGKPIHRAAFNEITKKAVIKAIENPRPMNEALFNAQQARRVLDRLVGYIVSPYLSKKLGDKLSAGRVQSVALKLIVEREREIEKFKQEQYFNISVNLSKNNENFIAKFVGEKISLKEKCDEIVESLKLCKYVIESVKGQEKLRHPSPPLTTSTLQQEASAKFKFDSEYTMKIAQSLYESGIVTYIRTDSTRNSPESIESVRSYLKYIKKEIPKEPNTYSNKDASQDAHEAIRPTEISKHPSTIALEEDQKKIYELIWTMFVASQMNPAIYDTVNVLIKTSLNHQLKADGKILKNPGWLEIAKQFIKNEKDVNLPLLNNNDQLELIEVISEKKKTQPPSRFNDGTLVKELDNREIGRPSTYASIIGRITNRKYVKKTSKGFQPTDLGKLVIDNLSEIFSFMDYKYTAKMELLLDKISQGKLKYEEMLTDFFNSFKVEFQKARGSQGMDAGLECPKCGSQTIVRKSDYGFFAGCVKYPECKGVIGINVIDGKVIPKDKEIRYKIADGIICPDCGSGMTLREDGKFGPFYSCSNYPKCKGKRKVPFGKKCPKCNDELYVTLFKENLKLACMAYPNCKHVEELPKNANIQWFDPKQIELPKYNNKVEKILKQKINLNDEENLN